VPIANLILRALPIAALVFAGQANAAPEPLLTAMSNQKFAAAAQDRVLVALESDPATASVQLVEADSAQVTLDRKTLSLPLQPGKTLQVSRTLAYRNGDGTLVWEGGLVAAVVGRHDGPADPMNNLILVRNGTRLTGSLRIAGRLWRLSPLGSGGHALVEVDESRMPPDHPVDYKQVPILPLPATVQKAVPRRPGVPTIGVGGSVVPHGPRTGGIVPERSKTTIRAMVVITNAAAEASGDAAGLVNLAIAETNQGYRFSGVDIRMELAGWYPTAYVENTFDSDLERFTDTNDGFMDEFHAQRNSIAADINVLIINDPQYCGLGWLNGPAEYAFSAVHHTCATGYYSFAHEMGHNQGAHHDPVNGSNADFRYGHGFWAPARNWRTIMAYACPGNTCPRINAWSNPRKFLNGEPMGTSALNDNHRVLNDTRERVAGFR